MLDKCGSCGKPHHHMCASEAPWLKWITDDKIAGRRCFDCWLLESLLKKTAHPLQLAVYYKQVTDWSRAREMREPFVLRAFLATNAIPLQQVCKTTERARLPPVTGKCKACKQGGELLACSFCTAVYHNTDACPGEAKVKEEPLVTSPSFLWACPGCFKKGVAAVQKAVLKPAGQKAAGAKKKRRKTK